MEQFIEYGIEVVPCKPVPKSTWSPDYFQVIGQLDTLQQFGDFKEAKIVCRSVTIITGDWYEPKVFLTQEEQRETIDNE